MGKVIKNAVKTVAAALCGLLAAMLALPPLVALLVSLPAVQNVIVQRLAHMASQRIGVCVSLDRVRLHSFNSVEINGLYVEDFDGDTLLYVPRVTAPVTGLGLGGAPLSLGRVEIGGAELWLRKSSPEERMNISRVVDAISPGQANPDRRFRMRIEAIEAEGVTFALLRPYSHGRPGAVDFGEFIMRDVAADITDFSIAGDTIRMNINSLACDERTGWSVENLSARPLTVSRGAVRLDDVEIRSRGSELALPGVHLVGHDRRWSNFSAFKDSVDMNISMQRSRVTTDLVEAFVPAVAGWNVVLDDVSAHTGGVLSELRGGVERARTLRATSLAFDFTSRGLPALRDARFDVRLGEFKSVGGDIAALAGAIARDTLPAEIRDLLSRLGKIATGGEAHGSLDGFEASASVTTDAGNGYIKARVDSLDAVRGRFSTVGFRAGRVVGLKDELFVAGVFDVAARLGGAPRGSVHGAVGALGFRGYTCTGISVNATLDGSELRGEATVRDPALEADLRASLDRTGDEPHYDIDLDLRRADLAALGLDRRDSISQLSGKLTASLSGRRMDDANGTVELRDAAYRSPRGEVSTRLATLEARRPGGVKRLTLRSEFADAEFRSRTDYRDMAAYLGGFIGRYITMPHTRPIGGLIPPDGGDAAAMSNYSIASVDVKNASPLLDAMFPAATVAPGSGARFMFNPYTGGFSLSAHAQYVEFGGALATDLALTGDNTQDSLKIHLSGADLYTSRGHLPRFELHGGARRGRTRVDVSLDGERWRLRADTVGFAVGRATVGGMSLLSVDRPGQRLTASGTISASLSDTLRVRLERLDLSPLGRLVGRGTGTELAATATGWLDVAALTGNARTRADVRLDAVSAWGHKAPPLRLESVPESNGAMRYRLRDEAAGGDLLNGTISANGEIDARVRADSLDAALLDPLLGGILEDTRGSASARLAIGGTLGATRIDGHIDVAGFETTVGYTRARYSVEEARIEVTNSILTLPRTAVGSRYGGSGEIGMSVDLSNLRNIATRIDARIDRMLAFDTRQGDNGDFYGRVFATGSASIRSGRMGTRFDISAATTDGTRFHLPLKAADNVSWTDFVTFVEESVEPDTVGTLAQKRLGYQRRLARGARVGGSRPMELNMTLGITPAAEIHLPIGPNLGPGITARGEGVIDLDVDPRGNRFTMTGDYNISSGRFELSMMELFNKTFDIAPGSSLRWSGSPTDAALSVDASWRTRTPLRPLVGDGSLSERMVPVDCIIRLRESLSQPEITFDISFPSADADARQIAAGAMNTPELKSMQFLSLLATGSFATDNSVAGHGANAGALATGAVGFDILTSQLTNLLSSDDYDLFLRYRPQDGYFGQRVEAGFSTRLWDNRLEIELEGNYEDDRTTTNVGTTAVGNFAGEGSATIGIDRAGNLRLRLFSRTIDRLNETQGLQENGLGIYYRRDFDRIRDIFRRRERRNATANAAAKEQKK